MKSFRETKHQNLIAQSEIQRSRIETAVGMREVIERKKHAKNEYWLMKNEIKQVTRIISEEKRKKTIFVKNWPQIISIFNLGT